MALINCWECRKEISSQAENCPQCGAKQQKEAGTNLMFIAFLILVLVLFVIFSGSENTNTPSPETSIASVPTQSENGSVNKGDSPQKTEVPTVNFDLPLQTTKGTLVCPLSAGFDRREGHGLQAAMKSRAEIFSRQEDAEKAGCEEWQEGQPIDLSEESKQQAKKWQQSNSCGMLEFGGLLIFSCELQNIPTVTNSTEQTIVNPNADSHETVSGNTTQLNWDTPATISGTIHSDQFDNCCINGVSTKTKYYYLELDNMVNMQASPDSELVNNIKKIQLGGDFIDQPEGTHLQVDCKSINLGNTGHYALPVYCNDPEIFINQLGSDQTSKIEDSRFSPSFNCEKASNPVETMICNDRELSALDVHLSEIYQVAKANTKDMKQFKADQDAWIKSRKECPNRDCVLQHYNERMNKLASESSH